MDTAARLQSAAGPQSAAPATHAATEDHGGLVVVMMMPITFTLVVIANMLLSAGMSGG